MEYKYKCPYCKKTFKYNLHNHLMEKHKKDLTDDLLRDLATKLARDSEIYDKDYLDRLNQEYNREILALTRTTPNEMRITMDKEVWMLIYDNLPEYTQSASEKEIEAYEKLLSEIEKLK